MAAVFERSQLNVSRRFALSPYPLTLRELILRSTYLFDFSSGLNKHTRLHVNVSFSLFSRLAAVGYLEFLASRPILTIYVKFVWLGTKRSL